MRERVDLSRLAPFVSYRPRPRSVATARRPMGTPSTARPRPRSQRVRAARSFYAPQHKINQAAPLLRTPLGPAVAVRTVACGPVAAVRGVAEAGEHLASRAGDGLADVAQHLGQRVVRVRPGGLVP